MSEAITVTVTWVIKPERAEAFVEALRGMFPVTRLRQGFRDIRLLRSAVDAHQFVLLETWDDLQSFQDYGRFREGAGDTATLLAMTASQPQLSVWTLDPVAEATA